MGHDSLINRYKTNFSLMHHYGYNLSDLDNMMPWERFVYLDLLKDFIKQKQQEERDRLAVLRAQRRR